MNYKQGSFWRKWDLHVHSPYSVLNNGDFGNAFEKQGEELNSLLDKYFYEVFTQAIDNEIACIGITDYFVLDGYKAVTKILNDETRLRNIFKNKLEEQPNYLEKIKEILILPNIEFRLDTSVTVVGSGSRSASKLQIHVIFSNELPIEQIEGNFLNVLKFTDTNQTEYHLNIHSLKLHGASLKKSGVGGNGSDLVVGMNGTQVNFDDIKKKVMTTFKNKAIIVLAEEDQSDLKWTGQGGSLRRKLYSESNAIFSSNSKTIKWCSSEESKTTINKKLACLWGSDAHTFNSLFNPNNERFCWIKSDTTFEGLLQATEVALDRVFIGKFPHEMQTYKDRSAYTIKEIRVKKNIKNNSRVWFDTDLTVNPFMVTIIGNKGSGKSALSDIIGYVGNSHNMNNASFLDSKRFLDKKTRYGDEYQAEIEFHTGENKLIKKDIISQNFDDDFPELVKYLPQRFIEEVCNDITDAFQKEINNAIFSYVPQQDKSGATNIDELIDIKTESIQSQINNKKQELREINEKIISFENKSKTSYINNIRNLLVDSKTKLRNHLDNKPKIVDKPDDLESSKFAQRTIELNQVIDSENISINSSTDKLTKVNILLQKMSDFKIEKDNFERNLNKINKEYRVLANSIGIEERDFISVQYKKEEFESKELELINEKIELSKILDETRIELGLLELPDYNTFDSIVNELSNIYVSIPERVYILNKYVEFISQNITNTQQNYFEYQSNLKLWELTKRMLEGSIENTESDTSVMRYEKELEYLISTLPKDIKELEESRNSIIDSIIDLTFKKVEILETIYEPAQSKITSIDGLKNSNIEFNAASKVNSNIVNSVMNYIDSRIDTSFKGTKEGRAFVSNLIESTDFSSKSSIINMIDILYKETKLKIDNIDSLLKDRQGFNNYIGSLEYLSANFTIKAEGKQLSELSPGERGIVLLIFYLALSKGNMPLIIDQPEDNLDNQSVFTKLVPAIVEAKKNRQVIVVTHNPNIAVACDSEQVIYCEIDKETKTLEYFSGSIENTKVKKYIIDILEGTKPAFDRRKLTYEDA